jgi:hypothetical protein
VVDIKQRDDDVHVEQGAHVLARISQMNFQVSTGRI